ncbi:MAG: hypothetical protein QF679_00365 [Candidatus Pacebacteria bacterium]|nr:hypothetical protein [Candidatus Paceibacterota bacterium]
MKILGIIVLILVLVAGGYFFLMSDSSNGIEINEIKGGQALGSEDSTGIEVPAPGSVNVNESVVDTNSSQSSGPTDSAESAETKPQEPTKEVIETEPNGPKTVEVDYSSSGYSPKSITISKGDTVLFTNSSTFKNWPASDFHPTHTNYPDSGITKCNSSAIIFDACSSLSKGESFEFTFNEVGTWNYHNHISASKKGTVIVK